MCEDFSELTAYFAVSRELPTIGFDLECSIIEVGPNHEIGIRNTTIVPSQLINIDTNIVKIKTEIPNVTFIVLYPTLKNSKTFLGKIKTLPYVNEELNCELINSTFYSFNDITLSWKKCDGGIVSAVKKCAKDVYLICTQKGVYLLMKDNTHLKKELSN